ncbi:hypothetical protein [Streptacidiphilus sp. PAMC 29251]
MGVLPPDEAQSLLETRLAVLEVHIAEHRALLPELGRTLPRVFLIEGEYSLAMTTAEAEWTRQLLAGMADGSLSGMDGWRQYHATGHAPEEWLALEEN